MGTIGVDKLDGQRLQLSELDSYAIQWRRCAGCLERHNPNLSCTAPSTRMAGPDMVPGPNAARVDKQGGL